MRRARTVRPPPDAVGTTPEAETLLPITRDSGQSLFRHPPFGQRSGHIARTARSGSPNTTRRFRRERWLPTRMTVEWSPEAGNTVFDWAGSPYRNWWWNRKKKRRNFYEVWEDRRLQSRRPIPDPRHQHLGLADGEHRIGGPAGHGNGLARNHRGAHALPLGGRRPAMANRRCLQPRRLRDHAVTSKANLSGFLARSKYPCHFQIRNRIGAGDRSAGDFVREWRRRDARRRRRLRLPHRSGRSDAILSRRRRQHSGPGIHRRC